MTKSDKRHEKLKVFPCKSLTFPVSKILRAAAMAVIFLFCAAGFAFGGEKETEQPEEQQMQDTPDLQDTPINFADPFQGGVVPFKYLFYRMPRNVLDSFSYNFGLNFIAAGLGSFELAASGADWEYYKMMYTQRNTALGTIGDVFNVMSYPVGIATPLALYIAGRAIRDKKMQVAALAAGQAEIIETSLYLALRLFMYRRTPFTADHYVFKTAPEDPDIGHDYSRDFSPGYLQYNILNGWPSGHTGSAFAIAAAMSEIYSDSILVKSIFYGFAAAMGLAISIKDHWASDVFAGALMGFAVGKAVGKSFKKLLLNEESKGASLVLTPGFVGVDWRY